MARDGLLPTRLATVHPRFGTPSLITILTTGFVAVLAALVQADKLAEMVSIGTLFAFTIVSAAVPILRRTKPGLPRPFRTPLSPALPIVSAVLCVALMTNLALETWLRFLAWLVVGFVIYFAYGARRSRVGRQHDPGPRTATRT